MKLILPVYRVDAVPMTTLDNFQSAFRAASGVPFHPESLNFSNIALISDVNESVAQLLNDQVHQFLAAALPYSYEISTINSESYQSVTNMLTAIEELTHPASLICTYRNLYNRNEDLPESLGSHVDVLTQRVDVPVLLLPRPDRVDLTQLSLKEVMTVTNHLSGDNHLISVAAHFTPEEGKLILSHIEDETAFERYEQAIGRIPAIPTESSTSAIKSQLLHMAEQFISSCEHELGEQHFTIEKHLEFGNPLTKSKDLCSEHQVDLLVLNSKDANHVAMDGPAYELAVEMRDIPVLLL